jgi:nucleoside-diphosphate-sugar epimerase
MSDPSAASGQLKIAVVGAAGNVGRQVCVQALAEGHTVVGLDRPPSSDIPASERYSYQSLDATDFEAYKAAVQGCDALVHLAAVFNPTDIKGVDAQGNSLPAAVRSTHSIALTPYR